jgi:cellulose synthase/poly-beta-1,6-N-acetylglucosamine synthase-like glycosyltransferase
MLAPWIVLWASIGLIIYAYVGFPLLLAALARVLGGDTCATVCDLPDDELPRVAIVFAAHNEEQVIAAKLENAWQVDYPADKLRVVVGTDGCTDGTVRTVQQCTDPRLQPYIFPVRRGKISVINDLLARTDAEIVVMTDASTMFAPNAVRRLVRHFQDPRVGCVTGELSIAARGDVSGEGLYLRYERWIKRSEGRLGCVVGCVGAIFAIRRSLYEPLPASTIVEDLVICLRLLERGYRAVSEPEAHAVDPPCVTAKAEMGRKVRIGAGAFQAIGLTRGLLHPRCGMRAFVYISHKVLRWFGPLFLIAAGCAGLSLVLWPGYDEGTAVQLLLAAGALSCLAAVWAYRLPRGKQPPRLVRPIAYFFIMNYALLCGLLRWLFGTQAVTWERAESLPVEASVVAARPASPRE